MRKSLEFYLRVFGLILRFRRPSKSAGTEGLDVAFIGNNQFTLELIGPQMEDCEIACGIADEAFQDLIHIAFFVPDLMKFEQHCDEIGVLVTRVVSGDGTLLGLQIFDPDGVRIEVTDYVDSLTATLI